MDNEAFVQNIKFYCERKGEKPTVACGKSGVGTSFITDLNRGRTTSVAKVQLLAHYLGVTVSELLGECPNPTPVSELETAYARAPETIRAIVDTALEPYRSKNAESKSS